MSTISLRLPDSIHEQARKLAKDEDISINQLVASALSEKIAVLMTGEYLERRAKRGNRKKFERVLGKVKKHGRPPEASDRI